ncbi:MAG: hypothetical protein ACRDD7_06730 [Peptostreptococcaceae bacterium]
MKLPFLSIKEHEKIVAHMEHITMKWVNKCCKQSESISLKEDEITNLLECNKELSIANTSYENQIISLKKVLKKEQELNCELMQKNARLAGKLDKIENYVRMTEGRDFK